MYVKSSLKELMKILKHQNLKKTAITIGNLKQMLVFKN